MCLSEKIIYDAAKEFESKYVWIIGASLVRSCGTWKLNARQLSFVAGGYELQCLHIQGNSFASGAIWQISYVTRDSAICARWIRRFSWFDVCLRGPVDKARRYRLLTFLPVQVMALQWSFTEENYLVSLDLTFRPGRSRSAEWDPRENAVFAEWLPTFTFVASLPVLSGSPQQE